jgi:pyruvate/2-oxoglutarate/acetoin dehydrogenase E1 component
MKREPTLTLVEALREALREEMQRDEGIFLMGEDVRIGGDFTVTRGLVDEFGPERVLDTPISETGFTGAAIGAALLGMRPVIEYQYGDFIFCAMDQIVNEAAKLRYMSGGQVQVPLLIRVPTGASGRGAQHAHSIEDFFVHLSGVKLVAPAIPYDAKGLLKSAIRHDDPVLFFEHKLLYGVQGQVPEEDYTIPLGTADVKRVGSDVTIVAHLLMLHQALAAANELVAEGIEVEVIDPRTLVPLDQETIIASVKKTGRLVVVEEGNVTGGWAAEVVALVNTGAFDYLDAPIRRVAAPDTPIPFSPVLEQAVIPNKEWIKCAIRELL